ncbi:sialyltransferase [Chloropicon primus]|nr:sialyltransferase [Chloropicon primus]
MKKGAAGQGDWGEDWNSDWEWGGEAKGKERSKHQGQTSESPRPPQPLRNRSGSMTSRRRNTVRIRRFIVFVTLLSVALLFLQHQFFHPHHVIDPAPVVAATNANAAKAVVHNEPAQAVKRQKVVEEVVQETPRAEEVVQEAPRAEEVVQEAPRAEEVVQETPRAEEVVQETPRAEEVVQETPRVEEVIQETPRAEEVVQETPRVEEVQKSVEPVKVEEDPTPTEADTLTEPGTESGGVAEEKADSTESGNPDGPEPELTPPPPPMLEGEKESQARPANFSLSKFNHADPCNSTLAKIASDNITFYDNETLCGPPGLPIKLTPDLYKLPDASKLFVHCENWKEALSSSVAQTELTQSCNSTANSTLPLNSRQVLKPYQNLVKRFNRRSLSCAVVGSSSQIFSNPDFGKQIDKHHVVIRLNQAPTNGSCAKYTGSKTTIRILNGRWTYKYIHIDRTSFLPLEKDSMVIVSRTTGKDYDRLVKKLRQIRPDISVRLLSREVIGVSKLLLKAYKVQAKVNLKVLFKGGDTPSSGLVALVIALNICSKVSLYGFGVIRRNFTRARYARKFYHYFSHMMGQQAEDDTHSFDAELALMASLGQARKTVTFCGINRETNYTLPEEKPEEKRAGAEN